MPRAVFAVCDETGHAITAALFLAACPCLRGTRVSARFAGAVLVAAVLLDLDHLPGELSGATFLTRGTVRPYGHSLLALVLAAAAVAGAGRGPRREVARGVAVGIGLHLARDLATGGAALFWPLSTRTISYPYPVYGLLLGAAALLPVVFRAEAVGSPRRVPDTGADRGR